jgi:hypothetical protein
MVVLFDGSRLDNRVFFFFFAMYVFIFNNPTCSLEIARIANIQPFHVEIFTLGYHGRRRF